MWPTREVAGAATRLGMEIGQRNEGAGLGDVQDVLGVVHGWWREKRSVTVVMYRKVEMYGWRDLEKVEIEVEEFRLVEGIKSGRGS